MCGKIENPLGVTENQRMNQKVTRNEKLSKTRLPYTINENGDDGIQTCFPPSGK